MSNNLFCFASSVPLSPRTSTWHPSPSPTLSHTQGPPRLPHTRRPFSICATTSLGPRSYPNGAPFRRQRPTSSDPSTSAYLKSLSTSTTTPTDTPVQSTPHATTTHQLITLGPVRLRVSCHLLLLIVPLIWSTFIICAKLLYLLPVALPPPAFNSLRLLVSSLVFIPILCVQSRKLRRANVPIRFVVPGIELGLLVFISNFFQILGLRYTAASRAAFINQLSTVLVPLSAAALRLEPLTVPVVSGASAAVVGIALLTAPFGATGAATATAAAARGVVEGGGGAGLSLMVQSRLGDGLEFLSAAFTSAYVLRMSSVTKRVPAEQFTALAGVKVIAQAVVALVWFVSVHGIRRLRGGVSSVGVTGGGRVGRTAVTAATTMGGGGVGGWTVVIVAVNLLLVLWTGLMVSAATSWLQTKGQAGVSAGETAVLFASQPVWASVWAGLFLRERMSVVGMIGAAMILFGAVVASTGRKGGGGVGRKLGGASTEGER